jgi:hypothetical protein
MLLVPYKASRERISNVVFLLPGTVTPPIGDAGAYAACSWPDSSHDAAPKAPRINPEQIASVLWCVVEFGDERGVVAGEVRGRNERRVRERAWKTGWRLKEAVLSAALSLGSAGLHVWEEWASRANQRALSFQNYGNFVCRSPTTCDCFLLKILKLGSDVKRARAGTTATVFHRLPVDPSHAAASSCCYTFDFRGPAETQCKVPKSSKCLPACSMMLLFRDYTRTPGAASNLPQREARLRYELPS